MLWRRNIIAVLQSLNAFCPVSNLYFCQLENRFSRLQLSME